VLLVQFGTVSAHTPFQSFNKKITATEGYFTLPSPVPSNVRNKGTLSSGKILAAFYHLSEVKCLGMWSVLVLSSLISLSMSHFISSIHGHLHKGKCGILEKEQLFSLAFSSETVTEMG
jgi:hypothetical protein